MTSSSEKCAREWELFRKIFTCCNFCSINIKNNLNWGNNVLYSFLLHFHVKGFVLMWILQHFKYKKWNKKTEAMLRRWTTPLCVNNPAVWWHVMPHVLTARTHLAGWGGPRRVRWRLQLNPWLLLRVTSETMKHGPLFFAQRHQITSQCRPRRSRQSFFCSKYTQLPSSLHDLRGWWTPDLTTKEKRLVW